MAEITKQDLENVNNLSELHALRNKRNRPYMDDIKALNTAYNVYVNDKKKPNNNFAGMNYDTFIEKFDDIGATKNIDVFKSRMKDAPGYGKLLEENNDVKIGAALYDSIKTQQNFFNPGYKYNKPFVDFINNFVTPVTEASYEEYDKNLGSGFGRDRAKFLRDNPEINKTYTKMDIAEHLGLLDRQDQVLANKGKRAKSFGKKSVDGLFFMENVIKDYFNNEYASIDYNDKVDEMVAYDGQGKGILLGKPGVPDMSDFNEYIGGSIPVLTDMIVSSGAFIVGSANPAGLITGPILSGTASGLTIPVTEALRYAIGHYLYGDGKTSFSEAYKERYGEEKFSVLDGVITGGMDTIYNVARLSFGTFGKIASPLKNTKYNVGDIEESLTLLKDKVPGSEESLNETIGFLSNFRKNQIDMGGQDVNLIDLHLGQISGNPKLIQRYQAILRDSDKYKTSFGDASSKELQNDRAINEFFGLMKKDFTEDALRLHGKTNIDKSYLLKDIEESFATYIEKELAPLKASLDNSDSFLAKEAFEIDGKVYVGKGEEIQNAIGKIKKEADESFKLKYNKLKVISGTMYPVKTETIRRTIKNIQATYKGQSADAVNQVKTSNFITLDGTETFADLVTNLQIFRLKRSKGKFDFIDVNDLNAYEDAVKRQMKYATQNTPGGRSIYGMLLDTEKQYSAYKIKFNPFIKKLIDNGNGVLPDGGNLFTQTFKVTTNDVGRKNIRDIHGVIKNDKTAMNDYRESIESYYKSKVFKNVDGEDVFDKNLHKKFMLDHKYGLETFFGKENFGKVSRIGGLGNQVDNLSKKYNDSLADLKKIMPNAKKFDTDTIYKIYSNNNVADFEEVIKLVNKVSSKEESKSLINNLRLMIADDIYGSIKPVGDDGVFNVKAFNEILDGLGDVNKTPSKNSKARMLELAFGSDKAGKEYLTNLKDINRVIRMMTKKGVKDPTSVVQPAASAFIRAWIAPPLTRAGRVMTGAVGLAQGNFDKNLAELLARPDALNELGKLRNIKVTNPLYGDIVNKHLGLDLPWTKKTIEFLENTGSKMLNVTKFGVKTIYKETTGAGTGFRNQKQIIKDVLEGDLGSDRIEKEDIEKFKIEKQNRKNQTRLSQQPINVAQMDMPPAQTTDVASAPVDNPQGIAALSPGQGSRTNAQTIDRMAQVGLPLFNRG